MTSPLQSLVATGTKLWLDSIDPDLVKRDRGLGATGATSNPIIISDLIKTGRFDNMLDELIGKGLTDEEIAWETTDHLVRDAQKVFLPVWKETAGNDGYVSFELDPLLEDGQLGPPHARRVARYIELGKKWSAGHQNRMIKIPATPAGLDAIEALTAAGVTLNVTLIFSPRQYRAARDAAWRGRRSTATWATSRAYTASSCPAWTFTPKSTCRSYRPPPRAKSASWEPSASGPRTATFGKTRNWPAPRK